MIHPKGKLYSHGDFALEGESKLWTITALGRMVGQTPIVFTLKMPDSSGKHGGYNRMILKNCMSDLAKYFTLGFSWVIFDSDTNEVDPIMYPEFGADNNGVQPTPQSSTVDQSHVGRG